MAAIDCTGHGVPGAFLSLLVAGILNETLKNPLINSPAGALKYLNQKLPMNLNKHHKEKIYDGMDMSLCALDLKNRKAYFSGANRPLWLTRKNRDGFELIEIKGTKASISIHTSFEQEFENHEISLEYGDRLFMFSDGITDQFGGLNGKKLGRNRLKEILLSSAHMDIQSQKQFLINFLKDWKGALEQVDDNLLIGIEID